jgi:hypothetical protein
MECHMAGRIRTLKPETNEDEIAASLSHIAWRMWVATKLLADDYGTFRASPNYLLGQIFWAIPTSREEIQRAIRELATCKIGGSSRTERPDHAFLSREGQELAQNGLWLLYRVRNQPYGWITGWFRHQRVDKPGKPRCPGPEKAESFDSYGAPEQTRELFANDSRETQKFFAPDLRPPTSDHDHDHDHDRGSDAAVTSVKPVCLNASNKSSWQSGDQIRSTLDLEQAVSVWGFGVQLSSKNRAVCNRIVAAGPIAWHEVETALGVLSRENPSKPVGFFLSVIEGKRRDAELELAKNSPKPRSEFDPETEAAIAKMKGSTDGQS